MLSCFFDMEITSIQAMVRQSCPAVFLWILILESITSTRRRIGIGAAASLLPHSGLSGIRAPRKKVTAPRFMRTGRRSGSATGGLGELPGCREDRILGEPAGTTRLAEL